MSIPDLWPLSVEGSSSSSVGGLFTFAWRTLGMFVLTGVASNRGPALSFPQSLLGNPCGQQKMRVTHDVGKDF